MTFRNPFLILTDQEVDRILDGPPAEIRDRDGFLVPFVWQGAVERYEQTIPKRKRQESHNLEVERLEKLALQPPPRAHVPGATRFTTQYMIDWFRSLGLKLVERESYDYRLKRHHDVQLGMDCIVEAQDDFRLPETSIVVPTGTLIAGQGAGKSERKHHWERFEMRGGVRKAELRNMPCCYAEFERGTKAPTFLEWWWPKEDVGGSK